MEITVGVDDSHPPSLEPRRVEIAAATSEVAPSVRPNTNLISPHQWDRQQAGEASEARYNAWLAPENAP